MESLFDISMVAASRNLDRRIWLKPSRIAILLNEKSRKWIKNLAIKNGFTRIDSSGFLLINSPRFVDWFNVSAPKKRQGKIRNWQVDGHDSRPGVIYGLFDPIDKKIRYIGKTGDAKNRLKCHLHDARHPKSKHKHISRWLNKVILQGRVPQMTILQECLPGMMNACECEWIARGKANGWKLCNATDGGEGAVPSDALKSRLSDISKLKWADPEYRRRWTEAFEKRHGHKPGKKVLSDEFINKRERNKLIHERNMAIHAARVKDDEDRKSWVFVPLTYGSTAFVPLTQGKWATVDSADFERVSQYKWTASKKGPSWRAKTNLEGKVTCLLNRFVADASKDTIVCIRDGNQLNCCPTNLRVTQPR